MIVGKELEGQSRGKCKGQCSLLVALTEVVAHGRLVQDLGNNAVERGAEGVVRLLVGVAARPECGHRKGGAVRGTGYIVKRAVVGSVQRAHSAVRSHARVARL